MIFDFCVVGGGIVGLATALELMRQRPGASLVLIEKEESVGHHQTGHNSGVIHAGIYYAPGSLKARLCVAGLHATKAFCDEHAIPYETCGKLIVATNAVELARIEALHARATANGLTLSHVSAGELREIEPNITGIGALLSPETAIVSYRRVCETMAALLRDAGAELRLGQRVTAITEETDGVTVVTDAGEFRTRRLVCCGGLQSDRLARMAGAKADFRIVPFRGEHFRLSAHRRAIVRHLIYPAPAPDLPFLGVHLTRMIDGSVTVGPNAVLGFSREGYPHLSFDLRDTADLAAYGGFWKLVWQNRRHAAHELRNSLWRRGYLAECRKYCPELTLDDLTPHPAGIRAQAVTSAGIALHDFLFAETGRTLHVCNAPSPAATSAIPIARMIVAKVLN
ncbi:L-2-hydroxyglutarate oxidase [Ancylobacter terrae]|uniref:L-2-hydroxyglutarate oxidase n=1 Tax=Ancylobacter sp. sgz301288 TaxID=3342077 RepID=UPI00385982A3